MKPGAWNIPEHSEAWNSYNNYMGKICKITFSKIKLHKNKLVSARNVKGKKPQKLNKKIETEKWTLL